MQIFDITTHGLDFYLISHMIIIVFLTSISVTLVLQKRKQSSNDQYLSAFLDIQKQQHNHIGQWSQGLDHKLDQGLGETRQLYVSVVKRLAVIEETQKMLHTMSQHMVNLETVLRHPQGRGHFGETQLQHLIDNIIPEPYRIYQHTLSNGKRADCVIVMPTEPQHLIIDAKFPLANFHHQNDMDNRTFKQDVKVHINAIAEKYIIAGETLDYAILFIPAEGIYHHIHHNHQDLLEYAQKQRVWLASPTTLMALLHVSMSLIRDARMQEHMTIMKAQLGQLDDIFQQFQKRVTNLDRHFELCQQDVKDITVSGDKISKRFAKIRDVKQDDIVSID